MKHLKILLIVIVFFTTGFMLISCKDEKEDRYYSERSELNIKINNSIKNIDAKIEELNNRLDTASEKTADTINENIEKLKDRKEELREDLKDLNDTMDDKWEAFKADVDKAIDDTEVWINNIDIDFNNDTDSLYKK